MLILGEVLFPEGTKPFSGAALIATLQDTGKADARARILRKDVQTSVSYDPAISPYLLFSLDCDVPGNSGFTVGVLVDLDGDGRISPGDFINVQSYPVMPLGHQQRLQIEVSRVPFTRETTNAK